MNKNFTILSIVTAITLFAVAFGALVVQAQPVEEAATNPAAYEVILGKSLKDQNVANFIASNHCSSTGQFQLCNAAGVALQVGQGEKVETVYIYPNKTGDFSAYSGALPLGLAFNDTMADVEDWLGQPSVAQAPQAGWELGLPDESGTAGHTQYWAVYKRFGLTIIYNSPSATDKGATIHAILVSK